MSTAVKDIVQQRREGLEAFEEIATRVAADCGGAGSTARRGAIAKQHMTADEILLVEAIIGTDDEKLGLEISRLSRVALWQPLVGTSESRNAARQKHKELQQKLAARGSELEMLIADARRELAQLQAEEKQAADLVRTQLNAVEKLRELCPPHIQQDARLSRNRWRDENGKRLAELESKIKSIKELAPLSPESRAVVKYAESQRGQPLLGRNGVDPNAWKSYVDGLKAELPELEKELAELLEDRAEVWEQARLVEDFYIS